MNTTNRLRRHFTRTLIAITRFLTHPNQIPKIKIGEPISIPTPHKENDPIIPQIKTIAYYLPQFHPFPENDLWWGKGFTEWSNVGKAIPNYKEHYQPHCPIHLGYYDLRLVENMIEQATLAKSYGIHGFCYYFYWFDGKVLMHQPLEQMLADPRVDMPFCLMWANENWTRRWDGKEDDILIGQKHSADDSKAFIHHLEKYFRDDRYIKIDGKPVLGVYRANLIPEIRETESLWRTEARRMGFPGLYLIAAQSFDIESPEPYGFDAAMQFPPHPLHYKSVNHEVSITNPSFHGNIYSYAEAVNSFIQKPKPTYKLMRACMLSWDNTARRQDASTSFKDFNLTTYQQWLSHNLNATAHDEKLKTDEKLIFINAWNEWAEGTHLEPDRRYGYGYLQATYDALRHYDRSVFSSTSVATTLTRQHPTALILHLHYPEVSDQLITQIENAFPKGDVDLYITVTSGKLAEKARQRFPNAYVRLVENRGRDILPFLLIYQIIINLGYQAVCKIHSKRSVYRPDGDELLNRLIQPLIGSAASVSQIVQQFSESPKLGMLVPRRFLLPATRRNTAANVVCLDWLEELTGIEYGYSKFAAGTMFWFRPEALVPLLKLKPEHFEMERGFVDGTLTHAVERMMTSWCLSQQYQVGTI